jgi:hypothetical protein
LAIGRGCGAWDKDGHHAEVSIKAGYLGTECRIACLVKVLDGTRDAAGDDPIVEGSKGWNQFRKPVTKSKAVTDSWWTFMGGGADFGGGDKNLRAGGIVGGLASLLG